MNEDQEAPPLLSPLPSRDLDEQDANNHDIQNTPLPFANPYTDLAHASTHDSLQHLVKIEDNPVSQNEIKQEPFNTPGPMTPTATLDGSAQNVDEETAKAIAAAQNEYGTRVRGPKKQDKDMVPIADVDMSDAALKPVTTVVPKKRPPPKSASTAAKAAASGIKKPPPKKRKLDAPDDPSTPASSKQSPTPSSVSGRASKTPAASKPGKTSRSTTPKASSPRAAASPAASDVSDDQVYCICRKPDDHTFMIGCDGVCDDWFHGKCVNVRKDDEGLVDKFICPGCTEKGVGVTTWKPMCRREGCRKPARLRKGEESKYCSRECGITFMRVTLRRAAGAEPDSKSPPKKAKNNKDDPPVDIPLPLEQQEPADSDVGPVGGRIRTYELKALAQSTASVDEFRSLGSAPMITPPPSASPDVARNVIAEDHAKPPPSHTDPEQSRLTEIADRKSELRLRRQILKDRGQFVTLMKAQRDRTAERLKIKDVCGFDPRWSLDDLEFKTWRDSEEGRAAFESGSLDAAGEPVSANERKKSGDSNGDVAMSEESASKICLRKRCERHRQWQKLVLQDVRFEEADVGNEMRRIDAEEREIRQRAVGRAREQERQISGVQQSYEGWVEVVGQEGGNAADPMDQDSPHLDEYGHSREEDAAAPSTDEPTAIMQE